MNTSSCHNTFTPYNCRPYPVCQDLGLSCRGFNLILPYVNESVLMEVILRSIMMDRAARRLPLWLTTTYLIEGFPFIVSLHVLSYLYNMFVIKKNMVAPFITAPTQPFKY